MGKIIWKDEYDNVETYENIPEFLSDLGQEIRDSLFSLHRLYYGEGDYDDDKCAFIELDEAMKTVTDLIYKISEQITT